jgi:hypothetical protein
VSSSNALAAAGLEEAAGEQPLAASAAGAANRGEKHRVHGELRILNQEDSPD